MKIAIYGDSFGCLFTKWDMPKPRDPALGWPQLLEEQHIIDNFSMSGSAFMYSYEQFLNNHSKYDLNIFVVTDPQRTYVKALGSDIKVFGSYWAREEMKRMRAGPWYEKRDTHIEILQSVEIYLDKWVDWEMIKHVQHVLVDNLWNIGNTLVVPAFPDSMRQTTDNLFDMAKYEMKLVNEQRFNEFDFLWLLCKRTCHFSGENNKMIADKMLAAIDAGDKIFTLNKSDLITPTKDFDYYVGSNKPSWVTSIINPQ